ncbi:MAG TPA: hypothetical protein VJ396_02835 [Acidiferrobacterales bacterium]|nr:hypothetical protein [Acidiferrobacterales bacterium]
MLFGDIFSHQVHVESAGPVVRLPDAWRSLPNYPPYYHDAIREGRINMNTFLLVGIIANTLLTGLAIYWVWRNMKPKGPDKKDRK